MTTETVTERDGVRVERVVTHGTFELDGGSWEVDNNVWIVGDDSACVVIDAAHRAEPILEAVGNCALFESARHWAYREIRHHWGNPNDLATAIHHEATLRNLEFPEPLPASEVRAIAASIHRWIVTHSRMWHDGPAVYEATYVAMQSARGKKSATARRERSTAIRKELQS